MIGTGDELEVFVTRHSLQVGERFGSYFLSYKLNLRGVDACKHYTLDFKDGGAVEVQAFSVEESQDVLI